MWALRISWPVTSPKSRPTPRDSRTQRWAARRLTCLKELTDDGQTSPPDDQNDEAPSECCQSEAEQQATVALDIDAKDEEVTQYRAAEYADSHQRAKGSGARSQQQQGRHEFNHP